MLFQTCTKLTLGLPDVFVVTVIARKRFKRFLSNFNVVAIQNCPDGSVTP